MIFGRYFTAIINFFGFPPSLGPQQEILNQNNVPAVHHDVNDMTFIPPGVGELEEDVIHCEYPDMMNEYTVNRDPNNRQVWLKHNTDPSKNYDINTNYETKWPKGVSRTYGITIEENGEMNLDGVPFPYAKVVDGKWPGRWIQACWGDQVLVTVTNKLKYNGTAIHMHGIRMLDSNLNDGVPGVTQCPIPPNGSYTYNFTATQYGTTWYHSHYSLQYTDGVLGPLTIHGPASANYDGAIDPIILGDHNHRSAFMDYYQEQGGKSPKGKGPPKMTSILINGKGNYAGAYPEKRYTKHVGVGEKRIIRIINSSTDSTYIFSIDDHELEVIEADLVPIVPYTTNHISIGIGQRYHAILHTKKKDQLSDSKAYWVRVHPADGCHNFETFPDARQGILWYGDAKTPPIPTTEAYRYNATCRDEQGWRPMVNWTVPELGRNEKNKMMPNASIYLSKWNLPKEWADQNTTMVNNWNIYNDTTAWVNYKGPTVKHLDAPYPPNGAVYPINANGTGYQGWNYMIIIGGNQDNPSKVKGGKMIPAAHPLHLHGHDFALLQQSEFPFNGSKSLNMTFTNPPRRDVVLLPKNGFVVIAFKTDNPGPWVMHCHIAWHASAGLAFQALEEKDKFKTQLKKRTPPWQLRQLDNTCAQWEKWQNNRKNYYHEDRFQDDSGI